MVNGSIDRSIDIPIEVDIKCDYLLESYLGPCRISVMELFCEGNDGAFLTPKNREHFPQVQIHIRSLRGS